MGGYLLSGEDDGEPVDPNTTAPAKLLEDHDYYIVVRTIELYPTQPDGKAWDRVDDSGPDIRFELNWQGNIIFDGQKKSDTLIGSWEALSLDLKTAILSQKIDLGSAIDAAIIRTDTADDVLLTVWDDDLTGKDEAGEVLIALDDLKLGDNEMSFEMSEDNAIKRLVVRVIDKSLPLEALVKEATR